MIQPGSGKALANERKYPNIVELVVPDDGLEVELSSRIMEFHKSRHLQPRHGRWTTTKTITPIVGGALPIWARLATSSNSLAAHCTKLACKAKRGGLRPISPSYRSYWARPD